MCLDRTNWPNHSACMHFPRRGISKHDFGFMTNVVFLFFFFLEVLVLSQPHLHLQQLQKKDCTLQRMPYQLGYLCPSFYCNYLTACPREFLVLTITLCTTESQNF